MAAPLYFQPEIDALLKMKKRIVADAWKPLTPAHKREAGKRQNSFEDVATMEAKAFDGSDKYEFQIELCHNLRNDAIAITLFAQIVPRNLTPICRYDVHDSPHNNPKWYSPRKIASGKVHRHIYNERAIRDGDLASWSDCGDSVRLPTGGSPASQRDRLKRKFIGDLNLHFDQREDQTLFVEFAT
jgi:hypothetical protein